MAADRIKLDVGGYEAKVIPGCSETLTARPIIISELHQDGLLERFGVTRRVAVAPLFAASYHAAVFTNHDDPLV